MSASELIEQFKGLSPVEQKAVAEFIRNLPESEQSGEQSVIRYAPAARVKAAADKIFAANEQLFRKLAE